MTSVWVIRIYVCTTFKKQDEAISAAVEFNICRFPCLARKLAFANQ